MAGKRDDGQVSPERAAELAAVKAEVWRRIGPELATARLVPLLTAPLDLALPLLRRRRGRTGVALAPDLVTQLNTVVAVAAVHVARGRPRSPADRWLAAGAAVWCAASPLLAVRTERLVVLRGRSPLWGYVLGGVTSLPLGVAAVTAMLVTGRAARDEHRRSLGS